MKKNLINWSKKYIFFALVILFCVQIVFSFNVLGLESNSFAVNIPYFKNKDGYGDGTGTNPYLIKNNNDLKHLSLFVAGGNDTSNTHFKLENDLELDEIKPIGVKETQIALVTYFKGVFDGNFKVIYYKQPNISNGNLGLFGYTNGATIKNLKVRPTFNFIKSEESYNVGGIVGYAKNTTITHCGLVDGSNIGYGNANITFGGIVGYAESSDISYCYNIFDIDNPVWGDYNAVTGGIVGYADNTSVSYCFNQGNITSGSDYANISKVGGICGEGKGVSILNCYNVGKISSDAVEQIEKTKIDSFSTNFHRNTHLHVSGTMGLVVDINNINVCYYSDFNQYYDKWQFLYNPSEEWLDEHQTSGNKMVLYAHNSDAIDNLNCYTRTFVEAYAGGIAGITDTSPTFCYNIGEIQGGTSVMDLNISWFYYYTASLGSNLLTTYQNYMDGTFEGMKITVENTTDKFYYSDIVGSITTGYSYDTNNYYKSDSLNYDFNNSFKLNYVQYVAQIGSCSPYYLDEERGVTWNYRFTSPNRAGEPQCLAYPGKSQPLHKESVIQGKYGADSDENIMKPIYFIDPDDNTDFFKNEVSFTGGNLSMKMRDCLENASASVCEIPMEAISDLHYNQLYNYNNLSNYDATKFALSEECFKTSLVGSGYSNNDWAVDPSINNGYPYIKALYWASQASNN